jgi:protein tyrosine phosphatase (PTP) superfamily phosphohydrolase (DUF442 family)
MGFADVTQVVQRAVLPRAGRQAEDAAGKTADQAISKISTPVAGRLSALEGRIADSGAADLCRIGDRFPKMLPLGYKIYGMMTRKPAAEALQRFGRLGPTLARGGEPTAQGFQQLAREGFNTIINLRPENTAEHDLVKSLGMKPLEMPLPPLGSPSNEQMLGVLREAFNPANGKVFFHCYHGVDRTGDVAAAIRIARDGWTPERAIQEMDDFGFHMHGQQPKLDFVRQFADYWKGLDPAAQASVLQGAKPQRDFMITG